MAVTIDDEAVEEAGASGVAQRSKDGWSIEGRDEPAAQDIKKSPASGALRNFVVMLKGDIRLSNHLTGGN